jgi:hypothetical protein
MFKLASKQTFAISKFVNVKNTNKSVIIEVKKQI